MATINQRVKCVTDEDYLSAISKMPTADDTRILIFVINWQTVRRVKELLKKKFELLPYTTHDLTTKNNVHYMVGTYGRVLIGHHFHEMHIFGNMESLHKEQLEIINMKINTRLTTRDSNVFFYTDNIPKLFLKEEGN